MALQPVTVKYIYFTLTTFNNKIRMFTSSLCLQLKIEECSGRSAEVYKPIISQGFVALDNCVHCYVSWYVMGLYTLVFLPQFFNSKESQNVCACFSFKGSLAIVP